MEFRRDFPSCWRSIDSLDHPLGLAAILGSALSGEFLEQPVEMREIVEAAFKADVRDARLILLQELGRVKLSMKQAENGLGVFIAAERAETIDLLRRHIDQLAQQLRDLGYRDVQFSFSDNARNSDANARAGREMDHAGASDDGALQSALQPKHDRTPVSSGSLDLRF